MTATTITKTRYGRAGPSFPCSVRTRPTLGTALVRRANRGRIDGAARDEKVASTAQHPTITHTGAVGCAKCCTVFATSGVLFLCLIGTLLTKQPLYVLGVDDPEAAAKSVFDAAWMYFAVLAASFGVLFWDRAEQRRRPVGRRPGMPEYGAISHKDDDDL